MKKIFTLLLGMGSLTAVFAQSGHSRNDRNPSGDYGNGRPQNQPQGGVYDRQDRHSDDYSMMRDRDAQIQRINWDFDNRIQSIKRDRFLRYGQKNRQIRMLENQRMEQIRQINDRFSRNKTVFYDNHSYGSKGNRY